MSTAKTYFSLFALIVGCVVIGYTIWTLAGLTRVEAALTLSCLLLGAAQIITHLSRDRRFERTMAQVDDLALASSQTIRRLSGLHVRAVHVLCPTSHVQRSLPVRASQIRIAPWASPDATQRPSGL